VNFADQLRTDHEVGQLSFVDIAKEVGRRWQELPAEQKRAWESNAARAMQEYESQMDAYKKTEHWKKYQHYLNDFRAKQNQPSSGKRPAASRSTTDSSNNTQGYSHASPRSTGSPIIAQPLASTGPEAEACHNALTLAFSELVALRGEVLDSGMQPYDATNLPPEEMIQRAMYAFIGGTGSLVFMWTYEQANTLLNRIYRPKDTPVDSMTLAECFTVAAMGAHYDMDCFPDNIRKLLYASGTLYFHEQTARQDYLRTMRLLLSMSFYALLEKHLSSRYLVGEFTVKRGWKVGTDLFLAAGLQIARWKCPALHAVTGIPADENWRKIFRSLIFMDSWLSYTLGYSSEVTPNDVEVCVRTDCVLALTNMSRLLARHTAPRY
jgi:hypothetical protein